MKKIGVTVKLTVICVGSLLSLQPSAAWAASASTTLPVTLTITAGCSVSATAVAFGTQSTLASPISANGSLSITCTATTPYTVGLDNGAGTGVTVISRKMTGPASSLVSYRLYQNSALSVPFGNTIGTDTVAGVGIGTSQATTIYGQVPAQSSPIPGSYADVVNVTITF